MPKHSPNQQNRLPIVGHTLAASIPAQNFYKITRAFASAGNQWQPAASPQFRRHTLVALFSAICCALIILVSISAMCFARTHSRIQVWNDGPFTACGEISSLPACLSNPHSQTNNSEGKSLRSKLEAIDHSTRGGKKVPKYVFLALILFSYPFPTNKGSLSL